MGKPQSLGGRLEGWVSKSKANRRGVEDVFIFTGAIFRDQTHQREATLSAQKLLTYRSCFRVRIAFWLLEPGDLHIERTCIQ
jgi:hypothetical protein